MLIIIIPLMLGCLPPEKEGPGANNKGPMSLQPSSEPKADPIGKPIGIRFLSVFLLNSLALFLNSPVFGCDQGRPHPPAPSRTPLHYPTKPLEFVVPTAGGSATDVMARLIASIVSKENLVCRCKDKKEVCELE